MVCSGLVCWSIDQSHALLLCLIAGCAAADSEAAADAAEAEVAAAAGRGAQLPLRDGARAARIERAPQTLVSAREVPAHRLGTLRTHILLVNNVQCTMNMCSWFRTRISCEYYSTGFIQ